MKTYEEALAKVQELIDEEFACRRERETLIDKDLFEIDWGFSGEEKFRKEVGYLNWKIHSLKGRIPGDLALFRFIYEEDGHDIYDDINFNYSES